MVKKIVCEFPNFENATKAWSRTAKCYTSNWPQDFFPVILEGENCYATDVWRALQDPDCVGISGLSVGHGNSCITTVQNYDEDFWCGSENNALLKNKYFNKVSCLVGKGLLPDMVKYGLGCGCGEVTEYWIYTNWAQDPCKDVIRYFVIANFAFDLALMNGATGGEAYQIMLNEYENQAKIVEPIDPDMADTIRYDAKNRKFFGDPNWRIQPPSPQEQKYSGTQTGETKLSGKGVVLDCLMILQIGKVPIPVPLTIDLRDSFFSVRFEGSHSGILKESKYQGTQTGNAEAELGGEFPVVIWIGNRPIVGKLTLKQAYKLSGTYQGEHSGQVST